VRLTSVTSAARPAGHATFNIVLQAQRTALHFLDDQTLGILNSKAIISCLKNTYLN